MGHLSVPLPDHKRRRTYQDDGRDTFLIRSGLGGIISWVWCRLTSPGLRDFNQEVAQCIHEVR